MIWHLHDVSKLPEMEKIVVNALPENVDFARGVDDGLVLQWACYTAAAPQWWWHRFGQKQIIQILPTPTCCVLTAFCVFYSNTFISGMRLAVCGIISYFGVEEWF